MHYKEITAPASHPYIATIIVDPADFHRIERLIDDSRELRLLDCDDSEADHWKVRIGCASEAVKANVEDAWG
jgi:hypothetical protein